MTPEGPPAGPSRSDDAAHAARNQALQGFGAMAILGEVSCLSAAIVALPAFVLWRSQRRRSTIAPQADAA